MLADRINAFSLLLLLACCGGEPATRVTITEASGVTCHGDELLIVDDSVNGAYFRVSLNEQSKPLIPLNDSSPVRVDLPRIGIWIDLEGIDVLADGRIALLSERLRCLIGEEGVIAEYDYQLTDVGRRGLEGIAVRALPDGSSRVAVLWEGGYLDPGSVNLDLEQRIGAAPFLPQVFVHDLKPGEVTGRVLWKNAVDWCQLQVPIPDGEEPEAQRFRSPDLVWCRLPGDQPDNWGFIVILSSQNATLPRRFQHHWLQRFNLEGQLVGPPLDIADLTPPEIGNANWEGLCWHEEGKSLVLVHENQGDLQPNAYILDLPSDW